VSVTRMPREDVKWVGLDVAKDAIAVGGVGRVVGRLTAKLICIPEPGRAIIQP